MHKLGSLSRPSQFRAVLRDGRRVSIPGVATTAVPSVEGVRLGLAVKASSAVERNRIKRRLRAAFFESGRNAAPGADVVVRADERACRADFQDLVELADRTLFQGPRS